MGSLSVLAIVMVVDMADGVAFQRKDFDIESAKAGWKTKGHY